jgi:lipopolysaccharide/colanic/teichoic acid biosynthesis glycosyltransferase
MVEILYLLKYKAKLDGEYVLKQSFWFDLIYYF